MRILLTGGSGFLGRNIKEGILAGCSTILAPSHKELDVTNTAMVYDFVGDNEVDVILHAAIPPGYDDPANDAQMHNDGLAMTDSIRECAELVDKIIFFGSGAAPALSTMYGIVKGREEYFCNKDSNMWCLRLYGVYGPYEDYTKRFISNMICKALCGLPLTIKQDRYFSYVYVNDVSRIVASLLACDISTHIMNFTPNQALLLSDIAYHVRNICKMEIPIIIKNGTRGDSYVGDNRIFRDEFPKMELTPLHTGIENLVTYYKSVLSIIDRSKLMEDK
jgi:UDP-glucose 4-epimerase